MLHDICLVNQLVGISPFPSRSPSSLLSSPLPLHLTLSPSSPSLSAYLLNSITYLPIFFLVLFIYITLIDKVMKSILYHSNRKFIYEYLRWLRLYSLYALTCLTRVCTEWLTCMPIFPFILATLVQQGPRSCIGFSATSIRIVHRTTGVTRRSTRCLLALVGSHDWSRSWTWTPYHEEKWAEPWRTRTRTHPIYNVRHDVWHDVWLDCLDELKIHIVCCGSRNIWNIKSIVIR